MTVLRARTGAQIASALAQMGSERAGDPGAWAEWTTTAFRVDSSRDEITAAIDGEATSLPAPLDFRIRPGELRVLVPAGGRRRRFGGLFRPLRWSTASSLWAVARARPR